MILTLSAQREVDPIGPLRDSDDAEDLWSLINSIGSIMSGSALSPWFVGESDEGEEIVLEFYASDSEHCSAFDFLPAIMLATDIGLQRAYRRFDLHKVSIELHPGELPSTRPDPWWSNYFNRVPGNDPWDISVSPMPPQLIQAAEVACPNLFSGNGSTLRSQSWGLTECAVLVSLISVVEPEWRKIQIENLRPRPDSNSRHTG